ncbi:MAG TPA: hypothetical protein DF613_02770 [Lachnospiraceae bacterium]|nr:hypothetical protein [Lachnospiraceae bacterium]
MKKKKQETKKIAALLLAMGLIFSECLPPNLYRVRATEDRMEKTEVKTESSEEDSDDSSTDPLGKEADEEIEEAEVCDEERKDGEIGFSEEYTEQEPLTLLYGTVGATESFSLKYEGEDLADEVLSDASVKVEDKDVLDAAVDSENRTVTFTPQKVSGEPVRAVLSVESENYRFKKIIYIEVAPLPLVMDADSIAVSAPGKGNYTNSKIYDADDRVDVKATLKTTGDFFVTAQTEREVKQYFTDVVFRNYASGLVNAQGERETQSFCFAPKDLSSCTDITDLSLRDSYTIKAGEKAADIPLAIEKRTLHLTVADSGRPFRSLDYTKPLQTLVGVDAAGEDTGFAGTDSAEMEGFSFPVVMDTTAKGLTEENVRAEDTAVYGAHEGGLVLDIATGNATDNYVFDLQDYTRGTLTISEETDAEAYVTVDGVSSTRVWEAVRDGKPVCCFGRDAWIRFALAGGYNKIYLADGTDVTDTGIAGPVPDAGVSGSVSELSFYLAREEPAAAGGAAAGTVRAKTKPFRLFFIYDRDAPDCTKIAFGVKNRVISDLASMVTFGIYDKKQIVAEVSFDDAVAGVNSWSYFIAETDRDGTYEELLENAVFQAGTEDGRIPVGTLSDGQSLEEGNNYVVFVKVTDRVGNTGIYGSNGVVLENFHDISVSYTERAGTGSAGTWNGLTYYSGDAILTLKAEENAGESGYFSGLKNMAYTVTRYSGDGKTVTDREKTIITRETEDHAVLPAFPEGVTLAGLRKYCTITKTLEFAGDPQKSQVITVSAEAGDHAGNVMGSPSKHTIVLDSVRPEVTSSHTQVNHRGAFLNGFYANSEVTYTVAVRERFLQNLRVNINDISCTLDELEAKKDSLGILSVTKDTETDISQSTDGTVYHFCITFAADGEYTVQTTAVDAAGNSGQDSPFRFVIDTVRPKLELTYTAVHTDGTQTALDMSADRVYADETVSRVAATAKMTERNFDPKGAGLVVRATDSRNREVQVADYGAAIRGSWTNKGRVSDADNRYVYELALPPICVDADYGFTYSCTDLAGNELETVLTHALTLDRVKPTGAVTVEGLVNGPRTMTWEKLLHAITFGFFGKNRVRVSLAAADETAGVASVWYLTSETSLSKSDLEGRADWLKYKNKKSFKADRRLAVYGKIVDKAGNVRYISSDGIIVDDTAPEPAIVITPAKADWGKGIYGAADTPGFDVSVTDTPVRGAYAGLKKIVYKIVNGTSGYTETGTLAELKKTAHRQKWTGHVSVDPAGFYSNDVRITVTAEDWSGNDAVSKEISMGIDNKAPAVRFSFDESDVQNGRYYHNDKKLRITVVERNFDASYNPKVTSSAGGGYRIGQWIHRGETHTAVLTFTGDSDYTVSYGCYDLAGNKSNTEKLRTFTVDKTAPVIRVAYDNHDVRNGSYYRAARTATVTVTEHNFDPSQIAVTTAAVSGDVPKISGWSGSGDIHTAKISFSRDAEYTFGVGGVDLAGNRSAGILPEKFTVDLTAPEITFEGIKDRSANNGVVAPVVRIRDTNFAAESTEVTLTGAGCGEQKVDEMAAASPDGSGMTVKFKNFAEGMDDIYTLSCRSVDKAGNERAASIRFSVNRDGSAYEVDEATQELLDRKYTNRPQDIVITEINVDELMLIELSCSRDGKITALKEGADYTVEKSGREEQWKKYIYRIRRACFEAEGTYVVNMYSEDAAHNRASNKSEAKTLEFTIDKTAPTMAVSNLKDGGRYKEESHSFTLNVRDNILLDYVEVWLDGGLMHTYRDDELTAAGGELRLAVGSSSHYQTISLVSGDKAGNVGRTAYDPAAREQTEASYRVLITADGLVQFVNNVPLSADIVLSAAFAAILLAILAGKWKGRKNSP